MTLSAFKKQIFAFLITLVLMVSGGQLPAHATYTVDPLRVELKFPDSGNPAVTSVKVQNTGREPIRLRAYVQSWSLDEVGTLSISDEAQPNSLAEWVKFNPKEFEIPVNGFQIIRMAVSAPPELANGEYRGILFFEDLKTGVQRIAEDVNGFGAAVEIKQRLGIAVYAFKGSPLPSPQLVALQCPYDAGKLSSVVEIANDGDRHARVTGTLLMQKQGANGSYSPLKEVPLNDLREIIILPHGKRRFEQVLNEGESSKLYPPGNYRAQLYISAKGAAKGGTTTLTTDFTVPATADVAPALPASATE